MMIHIKLIEPNFRCKVVDYHDRTFTWIGYAESKEALEEQLLRTFKQVQNVKPFNLNRWRKRAKAEKDKVIEWCENNKTESTGKYKWRDSVWKYLKAYLFSITNGKCAYCETDALATSPGDVEHFRPKSKVEGDDNHRGYYWLAYEMENYLPSCGNCNEGGGKMNHFPIKGKRAYRPEDDLKGEQPELLNPFDPDDNPRKHLQFVVGDFRRPVATVGALTSRGEQTKEIFKLNRDALITRRSREMLKFLKDLDQEYAKELELRRLGIQQDCVRNLIKEINIGGTEYCAAKLAAAITWLKKWEEEQEAERKKLRNLINAD